MLTDVDLDGVRDGVRDLDGLEYEKSAGEILVPRCLGSGPQRLSLSGRRRNGVS